MRPADRIGFALLSCLTLSACLAFAEDPQESDPAAKPAETKPEETKPEEAKPEESTELLAGHSAHGEAFNEGPRQSAYLMDGMGRVRFPVTTTEPMAQRFVTQGVAQVHGFWYFEAERSFRQAAALDPECAMAYWGMAMANRSNEKRGKGFIEQAVKLKGKTTRREQLYIDALDAYFKADVAKKKERAEKYTQALEKLLYEFPDDVEAKAFLALQIWDNKSNSIPIASHLAIDALIQQVFDVEPLHPAHHYRIHLWDYERPETAVSSAAQCGQSLPAIAHMWHMPGHIFSRLKRYDDACWQQEASARVDHAHMMRDRVMPDQIHNFAHNNEWLIRNLNHVGRIQDAIDLAKNMIELPRHPKYNTLAKRGSTSYGRDRLFETLSNFERWDEMIALCQTPYLEPTDDEKQQIKRLRYLGQAYFRKGDSENGMVQLTDLQKRKQEAEEKRDKAIAEAKDKATKKAYDQTKIDEAIAAAEAKAKDDGGDEAAIAKAKSEAETSTREAQVKDKQKDIDKAGSDAKKPFDTTIKELEPAIAELEGLQLVVAGDAKKALPLLKKARGIDTMYVQHVRLLAEEADEAIKEAQKHVNSHKNEVQPLAMLTELLWKADKKDEAKKVFEQLREVSNSIDLASPVFARLEPIAVEFGFSTDWRVSKPPAEDIGVRPSLDSLGTFRWQPSPAREWVLKDAKDELHALIDYKGKPVVVIFYLGYGCLHCAEQLHAFAPKVEEFKQAGIEVIAISSDDLPGLKISIANYDKGELPIPLVANPELDIFQAYRAYDDFEKKPLHGTFLIDAEGLVRWQDISYEPFMDAEFLLKESHRLLSQGATDSANSLSSIDD
ncbi:MAG TPA: redoxin domain-containing protein [Pirellulaceae bacterium]|nr:redoxin domain-containing protein [Planctomycetales bacterium]HRX77472.1 redoxin domain-containing protein [Pirellulaceae bacterium]